MSRLDRLFADMRRRAMLTPLTRADRFPEIGIDLPGDIHMALSLNK